MLENRQVSGRSFLYLFIGAHFSHHLCTSLLTPMLPQIRAATSDARFNLTNDMPSYEPASARMTGSMPLIDEQSLSGVDFALPEYDDSDFSADMEPPPDPRAMSADGERHAEEIQKILAETDVYVKYGLHQKAVDHLRRVFTLDADNVEAHERLKDIFVSQGREQEAEVELLRLAEVVAPSDPDRAEAYLQELLAMNGTHTGAFELARRFRLRVARMSSVSSEVEPAPDYGGGISIVDGDLDDLDLTAAPPGLTAAAPGLTAAAPGLAAAAPGLAAAAPGLAAAAPGLAAAAPGARKLTGGGPRNRNPRDSVDEFDPQELIGTQLAHGSPAPSRPPRRPLAGFPQDADNFDLEFEPSPSQATRQMSPEIVEALAASQGGELGGELEDSLGVRRPGRWAESLEDARSLDAQLDDAELGDDIDRQVAQEMAQGAVGPGGEDLPFDPDEARAFDAAVPKVGAAMAQTDAIYVSGFEETDLPKHNPVTSIDSSSYDAVPEDSLSISGSYDPYGTEAVQTPPSFSDPTAAHAVPAAFGPAELDPPSNIEDDLDEAEFYAGQGMYAEAIDGLNALLARFPNHRMVLAKLREVEALAAGGDDAIEVGPDSVDREVVVGGTDALDLDEIEEMGVEDLVELDADSQPVHAPRKRQPTVMLEKPLDDGDSDTHYDLGLAYKEMTLLDDAIKSFEKALRAPGREVQCRVMIGMCLREMGNPSEAIHQFKQGLHVEPTERERQSLYYEIGMTYEAIGDDSEALYYFEMVMKRDPGFADAAMRADRLRARGGRAMHSHDDDI